jgi:phage shock protein A
MRNPPPPNSALETLLEERDHLQIQINLIEHAVKPDAAKLASLRRELEELESRISRYRTIY